MDLEGVFAIVFIFGSIPFIVWASLNYKFKVKAKSAELVQAMIAKDTEVTPEMIKAIGFTPKRRHSDLRTALILLAVGIAFFIFGGNIPDQDAEAVFTGLAMFPILISVALFAFWYFVSRKDQA